jgi:hypothetical protein
VPETVEWVGSVIVDGQIVDGIDGLTQVLVKIRPNAN